MMRRQIWLFAMVPQMVNDLSSYSSFSFLFAIPFFSCLFESKTVTGLHDIDEYIQSQLLLAALSITTHILMPGGKFIAKIFRGKDTDLLYTKLRIFFKRVSIAKPSSSRNSSIESFVVCQDYSPPDGFIPQMIDPMNNDVRALALATESKVNRCIIPFVVCGDLRGFDSDMSYSLPVGFKIDIFIV